MLHSSFLGELEPPVERTRRRKNLNERLNKMKKKKKLLRQYNRTSGNNTLKAPTSVYWRNWRQLLLPLMSPLFILVGRLRAYARLQPDDRPSRNGFGTLCANGVVCCMIKREREREKQEEELECRERWALSREPSFLPTRWRQAAAAVAKRVGAACRHHHHLPAAL